MEDSTSEVTSVFQTRYNEFIEDLFGALPEYTEQLHAAKNLDEQERLNRFQSEVKIINTFNEANIEENNKNFFIIKIQLINVDSFCKFIDVSIELIDTFFYYQIFFRNQRISRNTIRM
jgi:hypothetical protein